MLKQLYIIGILSCFLLAQECAASAQRSLISSQTSHSSCPTISSCFTPGQNCTNQIVDHILQAKHTILVQAYAFSSKSIADALIEAQNKGILVKIILDKSQRKQKYSLLQYMVDACVPVWIDTKPAIAHNKIIIIDDKEVITGSFNFTDAAQKRNAENLVFINDSKLAQDYIENWQNRENQSMPYKNI